MQKKDIIKVNKTTKLDDKIFEFIKNHSFAILFFVINVFSLIIRIKFIDFESQDYNDFLSGWINQIKDLGGIFALKHEIGDYNIPYLLIIALLTYIPINTLTLIKIVSISFDYIMAIVCMLIAYELFKNDKHKHLYALITYSLVIILPSVILNSSAWAQCDSIYTTFVLISILYMLKEKHIKAFIFLGIAISFKLQAIFILPVYILIYLSNRKFSIFNFLIIPIVNVIMCIPAILLGRPILSCLSIYGNQISSYSNFLSMNFPNIYAMLINPINGSNHIANIDPALANLGLLFTLSIFAIIAILIIYKNIKIDKNLFIELSLWSIMIATFLLPKMHDRYMYMADVISILFLMINKNKLYIPIAINFVSLYVYIEYLYATKAFPVQYIAIINFIVVFLISRKIFLQIRGCVDDSKRIN